jgi:dTDP-4-dehydrorhamnose 3,5-epimerase
MSQFFISDTSFVGLKIVERKPVGDSRGLFARIFCADQLKDIGWQKPIAQINQAVTKKKGTVRGMHFQLPPNSEIKLVTCLRGEIWDVALDLRKNSPTFLKWHAEKLSAKNCRAFLIPEGFAHGYQTLTDDCELLYLHSAPYKSDSEEGFRPNDPTLEISWPLDFYEISRKDSMQPLISKKFMGIEL